MFDLTQIKFAYIDTKQIVRNSMLWGFLENGCDVIRPDIKVDIHSYSEDTVEALLSEISNCNAAITQNFVPAVAETCHRLNIPYISWVYDSPQVALFMPEAEYENNYIFMFDRGGMEYVMKFHHMNIYHFPLAANVTEASIVNITEDDIKNYSSEVSFVGSLYNKDYLNEKNCSKEKMEELKKQICVPIFQFEGSREYTPLFNESYYEKLSPFINMGGTKGTGITTSFLADQNYGVPIIAHMERVAYINRASEKYKTKLYTKEKNTNDIKAQICQPVNQEDEVYKVYYSSKINLNITHRGIISGIPQRVFDIMAVGGFVLSNYQSEIEDLFEIGKEIEVYRNMKEFDEKLAYYLNHEDERIKIGINGYLKVKELYNYKNATKIMLEKVFG